MSRWIACAAGALLFVLLSSPLWQKSFPPVPPTLALDVTFPQGIAGQGEPLVTTGIPGDGDVLAVRYVDQQSAILVYDAWGKAGPQSAPFAVRPGERRRLEIEMPALAHLSPAKRGEKLPLRVALDEQVLLQEPVFFHGRQPAEIYFALNPIGGTVTTRSFRGTLTLPHGHNLRGGPGSQLGAAARLGWMIRAWPGALALRLAGAIGFGLAMAWLLPKIRLPSLAVFQAGLPKFSVRVAPPHRWFAATCAVCVLAFGAMITDGTFRLIYPESFGHLFDYQAISLLQGRLDLPEPAHTSESFVFEGRHYIYFGLTPAVLRLPLMIFKIAVGQWSRCYMLVYYVALLAAVYALLVHVNRIATGMKSWPSRPAVVLLVGLTGLGTTIFFLASRAYVYHEAILCGAMFALWSSVFSLRFLANPGGRSWIWALILATAAVHARPPTGLFALTLLACAALAPAIREFVQRRASAKTFRRPLLIAAMCALGVLSFNGVSYLKFKSFDGAPLRYHVQYDASRLSKFDGRNFHVANLGFNFDTYFWRPCFDVARDFPFFYINGPIPSAYPGLKYDLAEPTVAMPYTMPALFLLAFGGGAVAFALWPATRWPLAVIGAAAIPMSLALLATVAISERYTADFCPALILAAAFGLQAVELLPALARRVAAVMIALLSLGGIFTTGAITLHYQGEVVWGVPDDVRARYQGLRKTVDGLLGLGPQ